MLQNINICYNIKQIKFYGKCQQRLFNILTDVNITILINFIEQYR